MLAGSSYRVPGSWVLNFEKKIHNWNQKWEPVSNQNQNWEVASN